MTPAETPSFTLPGRISAAVAARPTGKITFITGDERDTVPWAQLHDDAKSMAAALQARRVGPGSHVSLLAPTTRQLVTAIQAVWLAGATAVVLPLPMRMGSIEEFVAQTRLRIRGADTSLLVVDGDLAPFIEADAGAPPMVVLDDLVGDAAAFVAPEIEPES